MKLILNLRFTKGYIAHPYWPAMEKIINIEKESGFRRARSEANRNKALTEYLMKQNMTVNDYNVLHELSARPFYTVADLVEAPRMTGSPLSNGHDPAEIVIPPIQIYGMLAAASDTARQATRIASRDQIRSIIDVEPIFTGKTAQDGVYERFAVVTSGTGAKLSNQRALRRNPFIADFSAEMHVEFDNALVDKTKVYDFITYAGREVGIGASRKLGWGRFTATQEM